MSTRVPEGWQRLHPLSPVVRGGRATGAVFVVWMLWRERRRLSFVPDWGLLRRMFRFGLPTMPAV